MTGLRRWAAGGRALAWAAALALTVVGCAKPEGSASANSGARQATGPGTRTRTRPMAKPMRRPAARPSEWAIPIPQPYPEKWIREARSKHLRASCKHLVYKKGCAQTRTGRIRVHVLLKADGTVAWLKTVSNTVRTDPKLVEKCVLKQVSTWKFHPPGMRFPQLVLELIFSDKC